MDGGVPTTGHAQRVAGQAAARATGFTGVHGCHDDFGDRQAATGLHRHMTAQHADTGVGGLLDQTTRRGFSRAGIDHADAGTGLAQHQGIRVGAVVVGQQHDLAPDQHAVQRGVVGHRGGQHHAGQVVVAKHHGALMRTSGQDHLLGAHTPQPLAETAATGQWQVVGERLAHRQKIVVVVTEDHAAADDAHLGHGGQFGLGRAHPVAGRMAVDGGGLAVRGATELRLQLGQNHPRAAAPCGQGCGQTGHAATGDEHIAMDVLVHVGGLVFDLRRCAQATGFADKALVKHPGLGRPHKGLVIKTGGEQRRAPAVDAEQARQCARPAVDAFSHEMVIQLNLGHLGVGDGVRAALELHQRRRFFDARCHDAARAVVFPRTRKKLFARGQQGGSQRVAGKALVAAAIEGEAQAAAAVQPFAQRVDALAAHAAPPALGVASGFSPGL